MPDPGASAGGFAQLPTAFTDPGCSALVHRQELMDACMAWGVGERWEQPVTLTCGCQLWVGAEAERLAEREAYRP